MDTALFFIETLSNLHVGSGEINYGLVDNLIQRDPVTGLPTVNSSSLKGALREHFGINAETEKDKERIIYFFGSEPKENDSSKRQQGALRFFEADLLSISARTTGNSDLPFVNVTSKEQLDRQIQRLIPFGINASRLTGLTSASKAGKVIIEDLKGEKEYRITADAASAVGENLAILEENEFQLLCDDEHLPIISRNCLDSGQSTNLFYEQVLPRYSHLSTIIMGDGDLFHSFCQKLNGKVVQIGGNATIGYGYCVFTLATISKTGK